MPDPTGSRPTASLLEAHVRPEPSIRRTADRGVRSRPDPSIRRVGVLAVQGGVREHVDLLASMQVLPVPIRRSADLIGPDGPRVDAMVLPGGESSVLDRLTRALGLTDALSEVIAAGLPTLGTCAGLIMLADRIENPAPGQRSLGGLDITVDRNAFGAQVVSEEATVETIWGPVRAAFIRAPRVVQLGGATVAARHRGEIVAVRQGNLIGVAFHPELTGDTTVHEQLLKLV